MESFLKLIFTDYNYLLSTYCVGIAIVVYMYSASIDRALFLRLNALSISLYSPYLIAHEAYMAVLLVAIVAGSSVAQSFAPNDTSEKSRNIRIALCTVALIIGLPFAYERYNDFLIVLTFFFGRVSEVWRDKNSIVLWHIPVSASWLSYYATEGLYFYVFGTAICLSTALFVNRFEFLAILKKSGRLIVKKGTNNH